MNYQKQFIPSGIFFAAFLLLILLLKTVDVAAIGPEDTKIGLSHLNNAIHSLLEFNAVWYLVSKLGGFFSFLIPLFFVLLGVMQLIARKSLTKLDRPLTALFGLYAGMAVVYVFFELVIINYRPVIMPGKEHVEASFPSSHTLLACVIFVSGFMMFGKYIHNETVQTVLQISCVVLLILTVLGRLFSGVHWFTDIIGGILISCAMLTAFVPLTKKRRRRKRVGGRKMKAIGDTQPIDAAEGAQQPVNVPDTAGSQIVSLEAVKQQLTEAAVKAEEPLARKDQKTEPLPAGDMTGEE